MLKRTNNGIVLVLGLLLAAELLAFDGSTAEDISVYGTLNSELGSALFGDNAGTGAYSNELRLILEAYPETGLRFRAEGGYTLHYGFVSETAAALEAGLIQESELALLPPGSNLHREFFLDQAYAKAAIGLAELSAGIIPVNWGSAYLYNPSSRTAKTPFPGGNVDSVQGKAGIALNAALFRGLSLETYALADSRSGESVPSFIETEFSRLPFGARVQYRSMYADLSVGGLRELKDSSSQPSYWLIADAAGYLGSLDWYAEAACQGFTDLNKTEVAAGFIYTLPMADVQMRTEYLYLGSGAGAEKDYNTQAFLEGASILLARNYLFVMFEKEDAYSQSWKVSLGSLFNLNDKSAVYTAELLWKPLQAFECTLFVRLFSEEMTTYTSGTREFGGIRTLGPYSLRPYTSSTGLSFKWTF